jgi:hypothetical protein
MPPRLTPTLLIAGSALTIFAVAPLATAGAAFACDGDQGTGHEHQYEGTRHHQNDSDHSDSDTSDDGSTRTPKLRVGNLSGKTDTGDSQTTRAQITSFGYNDNDDGNGHFGTAAIAYPGLHDTPTEGSGTYDDPITFATDKNEIAPGKRIYVPFLQKYFIMEDGCVECSDDAAKGVKHVDLWMGPASSQPEPALDDCEGSITRTADIIIEPDSSEPVDKTPMFSGGHCTVVKH